MTKQEKGKVIILVAPSGGGKSTMAQRVLEAFDSVKFSVSATTRSPREGEKQGREYYFLTPEEFQERVDRGDFLEWEEFYNGIRYGTLRPDVERLRGEGYHVLLDIEVLGATNIKKIYRNQALAIFLKPPSLQVLRQRLAARGTETEKSLQARLERAEKELAYEDRFDVVIVNDELERAWEELRDVIKQFIGR